MQYNYIYIIGKGITKINELRIIDRGEYKVYIVDKVEFLRDHDDNCGDGFISIFKVYGENIEVFVLLDRISRLHSYIHTIIQKFYDENMEG